MNIDVMRCPGRFVRRWLRGLRLDEHVDIAHFVGDDGMPVTSLTFPDLMAPEELGAAWARLRYLWPPVRGDLLFVDEEEDVGFHGSVSEYARLGPAAAGEAEFKDPDVFDNVPRETRWSRARF